MTFGGRAIALAGVGWAMVAGAGETEVPAGVTNATRFLDPAVQLQVPKSIVAGPAATAPGASVTNSLAGRAGLPSEPGVVSPVLAASSAFEPPSEPRETDDPGGAVAGGTVLEVPNGLPFRMSPRQQAEFDDFVESVPRLIADPWNDGFLAEAGRVVFPEPYSVKVGRTEVGGGLVTAIKRRNPFGLLQIFDFFHVAW